MFAKNRQVTLFGKTGVHANVTVIPTGKLEVSIKDTNNKLHANFDELVFSSDNSKSALKCYTDPENIHWHIELSNNDARDLANMIEITEDEYEILMSDL